MTIINIEYNIARRNASLEKSVLDACSELREYFNDIIKEKIGTNVLKHYISHNAFDYSFAIGIHVETDDQFECIKHLNIDTISINGFGEIQQRVFSTKVVELIYD